MSQTFILRDYQTQAVEAAIKHFRHGDDPAVIVLPTGAGKSLVIAELGNRINRTSILITYIKKLGHGFSIILGGYVIPKRISTIS
jgi:DNA repair protein RadD